MPSTWARPMSRTSTTQGIMEPPLPSRMPVTVSLLTPSARPDNTGPAKYELQLGCLQLERGWRRNYDALFNLLATVMKICCTRSYTALEMRYDA